MAQRHQSAGAINQEAGAIYIQLQREQGQQWRLQAARASCDPNAPLTAADPVQLTTRIALMLPESIKFPSIKAAAILVAVRTFYNGYATGYTEAPRGILKSGAVDHEEACGGLE